MYTTCTEYGRGGGGHTPLVYNSCNMSNIVTMSNTLSCLNRWGGKKILLLNSSCPPNLSWSPSNIPTVYLTRPTLSRIMKVFQSVRTLQISIRTYVRIIRHYSPRFGAYMCLCVCVSVTTVIMNRQAKVTKVRRAVMRHCRCCLSISRTELFDRWKQTQQLY